MAPDLRRYIPPWDDGIAWAVAAAVLLAAVFLAGAPVPVAILLSLLAYVGLALARSPGTVAKHAPPSLGASDAEAFQIARTRIEELRALQRRVIDDDVRAWVGSFTDRAHAILAVIEEDRKLRAAPLFLQGIVIPSADLLQEYARLEHRNVEAAKPILLRIKRENLPLIDSATEDFYQQLHRSDIIEIDTLSERLEYNLVDRLPAIARGEQ